MDYIVNMLSLVYLCISELLFPDLDYKREIHFLSFWIEF